MSDCVDAQQLDQDLHNDTEYYEYLLLSLLHIVGSVLVEFISCSRDLYNLMVCGLISKHSWNSTFSRSTLLSLYSNQRDIIKRYDNFSVNLLRYNLNIKDEFTIWKIRILDIDTNNDMNNNIDINNSILFILSYITLIEHYSIKYKLPQITRFIKLKRIQCTSNIFECAFYWKHLKTFMTNIMRLNKDKRCYYYNSNISDNGETEHFECRLQHYDEFDKLLQMMEDEVIQDHDLLQLLKNELFLPNLIPFKQCWFISIGIKLFEQMYFGYYPRTLSYNAFCIKLDSKQIKSRSNEYTESFLVWNGVLHDVAGCSVLNQLQFNSDNVSFLE